MRYLAPALCWILLSCAGTGALLRAADDPPAAAVAHPLQERFADACLDALEGRDWLLADPASLPLLARRSQERELHLTLVPLLSRGGDAEAPWRAAVEALENEHLQAAAELGPIVFIRAWLRSAPDEAVRRLATMALPDLWTDAGLRAVPNGLLFLGVTNTAAVTAALDDRLARHRALWDRAAEEWILPATFSPAPPEFLLQVRRQLGWAANELGILFQRAERPADALDLFTRARALDPQNVSALLNRAVCVKRGERPELAETVARELEGLRENLPDARILWSLTQVHGTVASPGDFLPLGWIWTLSGVPAADTGAWQRVVAEVPEAQREAVLRQLQATHAGQTGATDGDLPLLDALASADLRGEALLAIARRAAAQGRTDSALRWLDRALTSGIPADRLLPERAVALLACGQIDAARTLLEQAVADNPRSVPCWTLLLKLHADTGNAEALAAAIAAIGPGDADEALAFERKVAQGRLLALQGKTGLAREALLQAAEERPGSALLYDLLLSLDYRMADKRAAEEHAGRLLELQPNHAFANYIQGSLLLERKDHAAAEQHFRRSLAAAPTLHALNDLAILLLETGRPHEAEQAARAALRQNERLAAPWDTLASALEAQSRREEAFDAMERAAAGEGADDPRIQLHWAQALQRRGDLDRARQAADKAKARRLELEPRQREELLRLRDALAAPMQP